MFGSGAFDSTDTHIRVCKKEHLEDFTIVSEWLLSEKHNNVWH